MREKWPNPKNFLLACACALPDSHTIAVCPSIFDNGSLLSFDRPTRRDKNDNNNRPCFNLIIRFKPTTINFQVFEPNEFNTDLPLAPDLLVCLLPSLAKLGHHLATYASLFSCYLR